jgi:hypothetical protein
MILVQGSINCLRLCVNVDYLLLLHDFFIQGLPKQDNLEHSLSEREDREAGKFVSFDVEESDSQSNKLKILCILNIENPQFIIYENQFEPSKSNSLIIDVIFG